MNNKTSALETVHLVAKKTEDEKALALKLAQDEHNKHQQYLSDLENYRNSYGELANQKGSSGVSSAMFRHYQGFLNSIDIGIAQQHSSIANMATDLETKRAHWQQAHQYSKAVGSMIEKKQKQQAFLEDKREQSIADELNIRNFRQRQVTEQDEE